MAIIIEEEKSRNNFSGTVGWGVAIIIVAVAAYYIFFAAVPAAIVTPPAGFEDITPIAQLNFNPTGVTNNPQFQALKQTISQPASNGPVSVGRTNPFLAQ